MLPPPLDHKRIFEDDVWNVFNSLGLNFVAVPFPYPTSRVHRLIPPLNKKSADGFCVTKSSLDWLVDNFLVKKGEGKPPKFNKQTYLVWYVLTETGQKAYDELSVCDDFEERFINQFQLIKA